MNEFFRNVSYEPYWWDAAPRPSPESNDLPAAIDVVIIGTGFTGVNAALTLSRAGRSVIALDRASIGFGASTRNGGQIGPGNQKFSFRELIDRFGGEKARRIYQQGNEILAYFKDLIRTENIDCDLTECGRFRGAVTAKHYETIARELDVAKQFAGVEGFVVEKSDVHTEIQSDEYVGGVVLSEDGGIHPGRFHAGLLERAQQAGTIFLGYTPVLGYRKDKGGFTVDTSRGPITTRDVVVATNAYTGKLTPYFKNKIIPVGSGIIATEPLKKELVAATLPGDRMYGETRRVFSYFRSSPDGTRILFGGRCFGAHRNTLSPYCNIYRSMLRIFPHLEGVRISHAWSGYVGMSQDQFPHMGVEEGVHYAMGYSGTGVTRSTYLGHKLALKLLGDTSGFTQFDDIPFRDHGVLARMPGAVDAYVRWMQFRDVADRIWSAAQRK